MLEAVLGIADHDEDPERTDAAEELLGTLDAEAIAEHHGHLDDDRTTEPGPTADDDQRRRRTRQVVAGQQALTSNRRG